LRRGGAWQTRHQITVRLAHVVGSAQLEHHLCWRAVTPVTAVAPVAAVTPVAAGSGGRSGYAQQAIRR